MKPFPFFRGSAIRRIPLKSPGTRMTGRPVLRRKKCGHRIRASFTVEAALLMTLLLPVLLSLLYLGFFLHDRGVLAGAACETAARADLGLWKENANRRLPATAAALGKRAGASKKVSSSVSLSDKEVSVSYTASIELPGLLPGLFGKSTLDTGLTLRRSLLHPADLIRKIRGLEYISTILKEGGGT